MGLIDVYRINPADAFSVYSPTLKKTQEITYYTLLAKIRGDLNITAVDSNIDNWNEAYDEVVVSGAVTGYETKTITLTRRDGSTISFDFQDLNPQSVDTLDMVTTRGNVTLNTIDVGGVLTPWVDLDVTYSNGNVIGRMSWDQDNATAQMGLNSNTILRIGQDDMWYVKNQTGSTIDKGVAVMAVGTLGASGRILVSPMVANGSVSPKYLLGITAESIPNGSDGYVLAKGKLRQINTSAFTDGQVLWCSPTTPGALTATEPTAPNLKLPIAFVVYAANNGVLAIRTNPGETLSENHQVQFGTLANNNVLTYVSANSRWQNVPISSIAATLSFSTIAVPGQFSIVADSTSDTLTVAAGTGMSITTNGATDTLTITNNDRGSSQNIFKNIAVAGQTTVVADNNNDTLTLIAGSNVTITTDAVNDTITINSTGGGGGASGTVTYIDVVGGSGISTTGGPVTTTGTITVTNTDKGSDQFIFKNVAVAGYSDIVADSNNDTLTVAAGTGVSLATNATTDTLTITNSAPDQTVVLTAGANVGITGTYPNFTISSTDQFVGTVTSVNLTAGAGMSVSGGPVTTSGSITVTNTDRGSLQNIFKTIDVAGQTPVLATSNTSILELQAGTGMTITTSGPGSWVRFTNSAPDQIVSITGAGTSVVTGTYPNFTVTSADQYVGTVTSVNLTAGSGMSVSGGPVTSSGSITVTNADKGSDQFIFKNIAVPTQATITASSNNDTFTIKPGSGISATTTGNDITLSNTDPGSAQNIFKNVAVAGQSTVVADGNNDTLTLVAGSNIVLTTNATTDSITIDASIPTSSTPGDAEYARDYATPFVITSTWTMVNLNSTNIRVGVNKTFTVDNRGYFIVTFEVESTDTNPQFRMFKYKLFNASTTTDVADSESYWVGYMYGTSEVPYTTFSFHIPSADTSVSNGDTIELHVQELSSGTAPNITYAALSYIDAVG